MPVVRRSETGYTILKGKDELVREWDKHGVAIAFDETSRQNVKITFLSGHWVPASTPINVVSLFTQREKGSDNNEMMPADDKKIEAIKRASIIARLNNIRKIDKFLKCVIGSLQGDAKDWEIINKVAVGHLPDNSPLREPCFQGEFIRNKQLGAIINEDGLLFSLDKFNHGEMIELDEETRIFLLSHPLIRALNYPAAIRGI